MNIAHEIEKTPLSDAAAGKPETPQYINKVEVKPVTAEDNPYKNVIPLDSK